MSDRLSKAIDRGRAAIIRLFLDSRPAAIFGGVRTIVVDAVKLMVRGWTTPHAGEEIFVTIPAWIVRNASTAVVFPILAFWIAAALAHFGPCFPFGGAPSPVAMGGVLATDGFILFATARLDVVALQVGSRDDVVVSAVTATQPISAAVFHVSQGEGDQKVEAPSSKIDDLVFTFGHAHIMTDGYSNVNPI